MTQNLGSTSNPLSMTGEQWVIEERTDDPLSPEPGECWIRTDLNAGDKIATLKFGDGSEVPIFPTATSEPGVLEVRRVQTGGQTGYLPVAEPDESHFPQFRLQHDNTVYSLHDDIEPVASLSIDTLEAEDIESDSVTIRGEITEINAGGDDATVRFDWGESNDGLPNTTADQLQGTTGIFSEGLTGLTDDTQYEFRAEGEVRDVFDEGAILSFTTPSVAPDSVVEDWERDNPLLDYSGTIGGSVQQNIVWETDNAYAMANDDLFIIDDTTNIPGQPPKKGDSFGVMFYLDSGADESAPYCLFGVQDTDNYYTLRYFRGEWELAKHNPSFASLAPAASTPPDQAWHYGVVRWHDGSGSEADNTIEIEIYEDFAPGSSLVLEDLGNPTVTASASDSEFAENQSHGFRNVRDNDDVIDYLHIRGRGNPDA